MTEGGPKQLIVVGDGLAGCMAAAALARALPAHRFAVQLVASGRPDDSLGLDQAADLARPDLRRFHAMLGISEEELVASTGATYALGTAWSGWSPARRAFFLPFGGAGAALGGLPFHQLAGRLRAAGRDVRLSDYSAAVLMAQAGRFAPPPSDPRHPLSTVEYGLHLPRAAHRGLLLKRARELGVRQDGGVFAGVEFRSDGLIEAVRLSDGSRIAGTLFIDATGPAALLAGASPDAGWSSWRKWLPCDRAIAGEQVTPVPPAPYGHCEAHVAGWRAQMPVQGRVAETVVYSSAQLGDREAARMAPAGGRASPFEQGRRAEPWSGNCVAVGGAAAMLEPQHGLGLHLVQTAIERLLRLLPHELPAMPEQREYNREASAEFDRARDLVIATYALNGRAGDPLFDALRSTDPPAELKAKLSLYRSRGRITLLDGDLLEEPEWALLLDEIGLRPRRYDALADAVPIEQLEAQFKRMLDMLIAVVRPLPLHGDTLLRLREKAAA